MRMPYGVYAGEWLHNIPDRELKRVLRNFTIDESLRTSIMAEFASRTEPVEDYAADHSTDRQRYDQSSEWFRYGFQGAWGSAGSGGTHTNYEKGWDYGFTDRTEDQSYRGYGSSSTVRSALPLGVQLCHLLDIISAGRRAVALKHHPDRGGDEREMKLYNAAADWLEARTRKEAPVG